MKQKAFIKKTLVAAFAGIIFCLGVSVARAQTSIFTYQGRLTDSQASGGSGSYLMKFELFADAGGATLVDSISDVPVQVTGNIFTVQLNFTAAAAFDGSDRFLKISVKRNAGENYVALNPLQPITSAPYSIKSRTADTATNALNVGGTPAASIIIEGDARLSDARQPLAGSANYIQNQNAAAQTSTNFRIDGTGAANVFDAATQFNIGGNRVLSVAGTNNFFAGINAGASNTASGNSFVGTDAGRSNTSGGNNLFVGTAAGRSNTTGGSNTMIGSGAGFMNTTGSNNSFVGTNAGSANTRGFANSFFGFQAGSNNTAGAYNSFIGFGAGNGNTEGNQNSFFGARTGVRNTTGSANSFFGYYAGFFNTDGNSNSFIGTEAGLNNTTGSLNSFVGAGAGNRNTTGSSNSFVGSNAGKSNTAGGDNSFVGSLAGASNTTGGSNSFFGLGAGDNNTTGSNNTIVGAGANVGLDNLSYATAVGADAIVRNSNTIVLGRENGADLVRIFGYGAGGLIQLCRNAFNEIANCSSSLRYKTNIAPFAEGLSFIQQLRPISFDWKTGGGRDIGFGAEDVAAINPLFVNYNTAGEVEGVKYDRLSVVFVNAFQEQQTQIERQQTENQSLKTQIEQQQRQIDEQRILIDELKKLVCLQNPNAAACRQQQ